VKGRLVANSLGKSRRENMKRTASPTARTKRKEKTPFTLTSRKKKVREWRMWGPTLFGGKALTITTPHKTNAKETKTGGRVKTTLGSVRTFLTGQW